MNFFQVHRHDEKNSQNWINKLNCKREFVLFDGLFIVYHFINRRHNWRSDRIIARILNGTTLFDA